MTCHEARELFSAVVDEALSPAERLGLDAHLGGCAECRRELERFRASVALVQGLVPDRAPIGFVDRVVQAARPAPWRRRAFRALLVPWTRKLPLQAAAMLLIGGLAVLVFQRTPELQQATRVEGPAPPDAGRAARPAADANTPEPPETRMADPRPDGAPPIRWAVPRQIREATPSADPAPAPPPVAVGPSPAAGPSAPPTAPAPASGEPAAPGAQSRVTPARPPGGEARGEGTASPRPAPAPMEDTATGRQSVSAERSAVEPEAPRRQRILAAPPVAESPDSSPPATRDAMASDAGRQDLARRSGPGAAAKESGTAKVGAARGAPAENLAALEAAPPVSGRLAARDPAVAERDVAALATRLGGRLLARRVDGDDVVLDVALPADRWADLSRGLDALGTWRAERTPPDARSALVVTIRLTR